MCYALLSFELHDMKWTFQFIYAVMYVVNHFKIILWSKSADKAAGAGDKMSK